MTTLFEPLQRLPDRPSELIRAAVLDLTECERDPRYSVSFGAQRRDARSTSQWGRSSWIPDIDADHFWDHSWHEAGRRTCHICFAGAVMAKSCLAPFWESLTPDDFDPDTRMKLMALNELRQGDIHTALVHILNLPANPLEVERKITPYTENRRRFFHQMSVLADDLEAHGL